MEEGLTYAWAVPAKNTSHSLAIVIDISWFSFMLTTKHQDDALKKIYKYILPQLSHFIIHSHSSRDPTTSQNSIKKIHK